MMKKKTPLYKKIIRLSVMLLTVGAISLVFSLYKIDLESLRSDLLGILRDQTGMQVEIDGGISWRFSLRPKVVLENVRIPNAPWAKNPNFAQIDKVSVTLNLFSLLRGHPSVERMQLDNLVMYLEQNDKGEFSMQSVSNSETKADSTNGYEKYPFHLGMTTLEMTTPKIFIVSPEGEFMLNPDALKIEGRTSGGKLEYNGYVSKSKKVYPFIVSFSKFDSERKVYPVRIAFADNGEAVVANVALEGESKIPIDFMIKGKIQDLQRLLGNYDMSLPKFAPMYLNLAGGFGHKKFTLKKSYISFDDERINLSGSIDWSSDILAAKLQMNSAHINLDKIFPTLYGGASVPWVHPKRDLNVFKDTPLYAEELFANKDIELNVNVGKLDMYRELNTTEIVLSANIKNSALKLNLSSKIAGGNVLVAVQAKESGGKVYATAAGTGKNISTGQILKEVREEDYITGLPGDFDFYLEGNGSNLSELMSSVTGPFQVRSSGKGYAKSGLITYMYGEDFLTSLRHDLTDAFTSKDADKKSEKMKISCAVLNIKVRNGKVETEKGIAAETAVINIRATGKVDLGAEKLNASLVTIPMRGLKLSISKSLVNAIEFSGNLAEPDIKVNGGAVAAKAISATGLGFILAPITGGLSVLAGAGVGFLAGDLLESWLSDEHPCDTALQSGAPAFKGDPAWLNEPLPVLTGKLISVTPGL